MHGIARNGTVDIAYERIGTGAPLVLLHGFGLDGSIWKTLGYVTPFVASGHTVILVDLRGHGRSSKPHEGEAYTPEREADDIAAVLDTLRIRKASVLGYSRGGRVALDFASRHPQRVDRLMVGGAHFFAQEMGLFRHVLRDGVEGWISLVERAAGSLPEPVKQVIARQDVDALRAAVAIDRRDDPEALSKLRCPALMFAGAQDQMRGDIARTAAHLQAVFAEIDGCNHFTTLQRADRVLSLALPFLAAWKLPRAA